VDLIICRGHLAAFIWQLHHEFEALDSAVRKGKKECPKEQYFYSAERKLETIRQSEIPREIDAYRNEGHSIPAIIGQQWEGKGGRFLHHFLPSIEGRQARESVELNQQLQTYFEYVVNLWLSFVPEPVAGDLLRESRFYRCCASELALAFGTHPLAVDRIRETLCNQDRKYWTISFQMFLEVDRMPK
jgi:hypothetical protein